MITYVKGWERMAAGTYKTVLASAALAMVVLAGCSGTKRPVIVPVEGYPPQEIFARGEYEMNRGKFANGAYFFGEIERLYPYSDWAKRGLIMQAFAHHENKAYDEARSAAQRYIDFYPADEDAAWAQFLIGLSYYDQIEDVGRDQSLTMGALKAFRVVIEQYPDSEYARSAALKFDLAFDHLSGKEMEVGRYYLKRSNYGAAINRFRTVVEDFQTTSYTAEALYRLVEAYLALGLRDEARTAGAILGYNFQSTEWYDRAFALLTDQGLKPGVFGTSWLSEVHRQVVKGKWL